MALEFEPLQIGRDDEQLTEFLCSQPWPFHGRSVLTAAEVAVMDFESADVASFWIVEDRSTVGLVRLLDLSDIGEGSVQFDLRMASPHRRRGLGTEATRWVVRHLFETYGALHRIEAHTRHDKPRDAGIARQRGFRARGHAARFVE